MAKYTVRAVLFFRGLDNWINMIVEDGSHTTYLDNVDACIDDKANGLAILSSWIPENDAIIMRRVWENEYNGCMSFHYRAEVSYSELRATMLGVKAGNVVICERVF